MKNTKINIDDLLERYLNNKTTTEENVILSKFLDSFQKGNEDWDETVFGEKTQIEERVYLELMEKINKPDVTTKEYSNRKIFLKIAASIVFIISALSILFYINNNYNSKSSAQLWTEKNTQMGERLTINFIDGTKIIVNANSVIKYPNNFLSNKDREVYLDGEAYFEVSKDSLRPFKVYTNKIVTTVLGTKFNVKAYPDEHEIAVSLVNGKVKVSNENNAVEDASVILKPNQQFVYNKNEQISSVTIFNIQSEIGWKDNNLIFDNEPLSEIFVVLERAYGVKFELKDKSYTSWKVTANFKNASLWTVIETIKNLTKLEYKTLKENNSVKEVSFYKH